MTSKHISQSFYWCLRAMLLLLLVSPKPAWSVEPPAMEPVKLGRPRGISASILQAVNHDGVLVYAYWDDRKMPIFEIFRANSVTVQPGPASKADQVQAHLRPGTFVGVIHLLPTANEDYREDSHYQKLKVGYYTMRYGLAPDLDEDNPSEVEQVVFLTPTDYDSSPARIRDEGMLLRLSRKASHTNRPAVMNLATVDETRNDEFTLRNDDSGASILQLKLPSKAKPYAPSKEMPLAITLVSPGPGEEE